MASSSSEHLQVSHLARGQVLELALQLGRHVRAYEAVCIWLSPRRPQLHCLNAHLHVRSRAEGTAKEPGAGPGGCGTPTPSWQS